MTKRWLWWKPSPDIAVADSFVEWYSVVSFDFSLLRKILNCFRQIDWQLAFHNIVCLKHLTPFLEHVDFIFTIGILGQDSHAYKCCGCREEIWFFVFPIQVYKLIHSFIQQILIGHLLCWDSLGNSLLWVVIYNRLVLVVEVTEDSELPINTKKWGVAQSSLEACHIT